MDSTHLFSPITFKNVILKNRIGVSPMCQYSSDNGFANHWHLVHLGSRAVGGAGLVMTEATAVTPEGRISPQDLGLWSDEHIPALKNIVDFIHEAGAVAGIQLAHAGRKGSQSRPWALNTPPLSSWQTIAPSALSFSEQYTVPTAMSTTDISQLIMAFAEAAKRAYLAGFKVLEIHSAHGYLLHEFLSPLSNQRTDEYGGCFDNRIRLLLEVIDAVKTLWQPENPLFVRLSATDWVDGGWNLEESIQLAHHLKAKGVDLVDASSGGLVPGVIMPVGPGYQTPFAAQIKASVGMATAAVGCITSPEQACHIIRTEQADLVFLARELLRDPYWPLHAAKQLRYADAAWPPQYTRAAV